MGLAGCVPSEWHCAAVKRGAVTLLQLLAKDPTYALFMDNILHVEDFQAFAAMMRARGADIDECVQPQGPKAPRP